MQKSLCAINNTKKKIESEVQQIETNKQTEKKHSKHCNRNKPKKNWVAKNQQNKILKN